MGSQKGGTAPSGPRQQVSEEPSLGKKPTSRDGNDSSSRPSLSLIRSASGEASNHVIPMCDQNADGPDRPIMSWQEGTSSFAGLLRHQRLDVIIFNASRTDARLQGRLLKLLKLLGSGAHSLTRSSVTTSEPLWSTY